MRKFVWILFGALFLFVVGCSGNAGVTPDDRGTMEEFFSNLVIDDSIAGYFTVTDADGVILYESTLVRDDNGALQLGETRNGEIIIDLTWLNWIDCSVDYLNPAGYTPDGRSLYYIGTTMEYDLNVENFGTDIFNANVIAEQRYLGGPKDGQLLPGASTEEWLNVWLWYGVRTFYDTYYIPWGTLPGNDVTHVIVWFPFNFWFMHFEIVLYNNAAGVWDP